MTIRNAEAERLWLVFKDYLELNDKRKYVLKDNAPQNVIDAYNKWHEINY